MAVKVNGYSIEKKFTVSQPGMRLKFSILSAITLHSYPPYKINNASPKWLLATSALNLGC